jgi:hypothetical protein
MNIQSLPFQDCCDWPLQIFGNTMSGKIQVENLNERGETVAQNANLVRSKR